MGVGGQVRGAAEEKEEEEEEEVDKERERVGREREDRAEIEGHEERVRSKGEKVGRWRWRWKCERIFLLILLGGLKRWGFCWNRVGLTHWKMDRWISVSLFVFS